MTIYKVRAAEIATATAARLTYQEKEAANDFNHCP